AAGLEVRVACDQDRLQIDLVVCIAGLNGDGATHLERLAIVSQDDRLPDGLPGRIAGQVATDRAAEGQQRRTGGGEVAADVEHRVGRPGADRRNGVRRPDVRVLAAAAHVDPRRAGDVDRADRGLAEVTEDYKLRPAVTALDRVIAVQRSRPARRGRQPELVYARHVPEFHPDVRAEGVVAEVEAVDEPGRVIAERYREAPGH